MMEEPKPEVAIPALPVVLAEPTPTTTRRRLHLSWFTRVLVIVTALVLTFDLGVRVGLSGATNLPVSVSLTVPASLPPEFATYLQAWQILQDQYVDPTALDPQTLVWGSIDGLVRAVGDVGHTSFLTPSEWAASQSSLSGTVVGIGAAMDAESGTPLIRSVVPDSPAARAGLRSRDRIVAVDGKSTLGQAIDVVISEIRGEAGSVVRLSVARGDAAPFEVSVTRARIEVPAVSWALVPGTKVADIRLEEFSKGAAAQLATAITAAQDAGATALVFDLRSDPGGYVDEAAGVASLFLSDGAVYQQRDRAGKITPITVKPGAKLTDLPLVVLIDTGTASAAEIVAGALQDAGRATLVGQTSFGTGTVLAQYKLTDGSVLLIGTLEWLTRDGRQIWHHGIVPDLALTSDATDKLVTPSELSNLDAAGLASSGDASLLRALTQLAAHP